MAITLPNRAQSLHTNHSPRTSASSTPTRPEGLNKPRPRPHAFDPSPAKPQVPNEWATIMPITTPDSAKATSVLRYEAKQARMGLISAAMRGDTAGMMQQSQRLGQLQEALDARGAQMFPSNGQSLEQFTGNLNQLGDDQVLGERSSLMQQLLVGFLQLDNGAVSNAEERLGAVDQQIDSRGGLGLDGIGDFFKSPTDGDLGKTVSGLLDGIMGGGQSGGGQQAGGQQGGVNFGDVLMGFLNPLGALMGAAGGKGQEQAQQGQGQDRAMNGAANGLMEMATRGIGGIFQNLFGGQ